MKIISFARTTQALLEGKKIVTRRVWKRHNLKPGEIVQAWDKCPRVKDSKRVALIEIIWAWTEPLCAITESDVKREGGLWKDREEFIEFFLKGHPGLIRESIVYRIEFKVLTKEAKPE